MVSATCFASLKVKSVAVSNLLASPEVTSRFPALHLVSAPAGKAASNSWGVFMGNFAPLMAPTSVCESRLALS
jgi:hypothetical protein